MAFQYVSGAWWKCCGSEVVVIIHCINWYGNRAHNNVTKLNSSKSWMLCGTIPVPCPQFDHAKIMRNLQARHFRFIRRSTSAHKRSTRFIYLNLECPKTVHGSLPANVFWIWNPSVHMLMPSLTCVRNSIEMMHRSAWLSRLSSEPCSSPRTVPESFWSFTIHRYSCSSSIPCSALLRPRTSGSKL